MGHFMLFLMFARIGVFSFGGGYAMLPLVFQSVQSFGYMSAEEFSNLVALSQVTPGPIAVNAATYVGFHYDGVIGALMATFGVALPSFIIVLIVSKCLEKFKESTLVEGIFVGIRPVTVGLIAAASIVMGRTALMGASGIEIVPTIIFFGAIFLTWKLKISPIKITLLMGVIGAFFC